MALLGGKKDEAPSSSSSKPLFKREEDVVSTRSGEMHTLLAKESEFEGKLTFQGQVRIDGKFSGQIFTRSPEDSLVIGETARVQAEINVGTLIVIGTVEGNVKVNRSLELKRNGRIKGNIEAPSLSVEPGAIFEGSCKMESIGGKAPPPLGGDKK